MRIKWSYMPIFLYSHLNISSYTPIFLYSLLKNLSSPIDNKNVKYSIGEWENDKISEKAKTKKHKAYIIISVLYY